MQGGHEPYASNEEHHQTTWLTVNTAFKKIIPGIDTVGPSGDSMISICSTKVERYK